MTLGEIVKAYREEHGLSQRDFAKMCEMSNAYISMLENNKNTKTGLPVEPSLVAVKKIACAMSATLNDVLERMGNSTLSLDADDDSGRFVEMVDFDESTLEFAKLFSQLSSKQKSFIVGEIKAFLQGQE